jgi:hypothetical protein
MSRRSQLAVGVGALLAVLWVVTVLDARDPGVWAILGVWTGSTR